MSPPQSTENDLRERLHRYGHGNWVGKSTTTPAQQLQIAQACVDALDQFDVYEREIANLRADLTIQAVNAKTVTDLQAAYNVVNESHRWLYQEKKRLEDAVSQARSYILDHGDERNMAPAIDILDRALGFVPLTDDAPAPISTTEKP